MGRVSQLPEPAAQGPVAPQGGFLYFVNTTSDTVVAGACANGSSNCSLRGAIQAANSHIGEDGIEIDLPAGSVINLTQALPALTESVSIFGPGPGLVTVRRASGGEYGVFITSFGSFTISGLTISNGFLSTGAGGGVRHASPSTLNLINCVIAGNFAKLGGGGVANSNSGTLNLTNCVVSGNATERVGGGIVNSGKLNLLNSTVTGNSAQGANGNVGSSGAGGGIYNALTGNSVVTITNSTVSNNSAIGGNGGPSISGYGGRGGGIHSEGGLVQVVNSSIANNRCMGGIGGLDGAGQPGGPALGGGICDGIEDEPGQASLSLSNSTVSGNSAIGGAGGGSSGLAGEGMGGGVVNVSGAASVRNTIVANNLSTTSRPDVSGSFNSSGFNLISKTDGSTGFNTPTDQTGTIASPIDPGLDPGGLQNNGGPTQTIALLPGSRAIDKGTSNGLTGVLTTDQRGTDFARTMDYPAVTNAVASDATDIGAMEGTALKITAITRLPNGHILLQGLGMPGRAHTIEFSPDLSPNSFTDFATRPNADGTGAIQFDDAGATGLTKQFYRLRFP